jgi:hypothetical protein
MNFWTFQTSVNKCITVIRDYFNQIGPKNKEMKIKKRIICNNIILSLMILSDWDIYVCVLDLDHFPLEIEFEYMNTRHRIGYCNQGFR